MPATRRSRFRGAVLALAAAWLAGSARANTHDLNLAIEASYLYKFAHFVTWPAVAFSGPDAPLVICIQGNDPFGARLDQLVADQRVDGHPLTVKRVARLDAESGCQIAYVAGGVAQSPSQALQAIDGEPVLTVTGEARGSPARGIVNMLVEGGRVRFSIDAAQADRNGVEISSKLLALAVTVKR